MKWRVQGEAGGGLSAVLDEIDVGVHRLDITKIKRET